MPRVPLDPVARETSSPATDRLAALAELFPEVVCEGRIDVDKLRTLLGATVDDRPERYTFSWAGKRDAIRILAEPSRATLIPDRDQSLDFDSTGNVFIEGDNLEVLKLLYKSYFGRVKMIYIDPPYNTGNDFVYPDSFRDPLDTYLKLTGQRDSDGNLLTSNSDTSGRYHSAWLSMMYPRLVLARQLLRDDGVICVSMDDSESHNLRLLLDEVFGGENHIATIVWQKRYVSNVTAKWLSDMHDFILVYARDADAVSVTPWVKSEGQLEAYRNPDDDPRGPWRAQDLSASKQYNAGQFTITGPTGLQFQPPPSRYWRCNEAQFRSWLSDGRIWWGVDGSSRPMLKAFLSEVGNEVTPHTWWSHEFAGHNKEATLEMKDIFGGVSPFDTPKPVRLLERLCCLFAADASVVLDFFAGSATTAHAVLKLNRADGGSRRFIMVQLPEPLAKPVVLEGSRGLRTIADIGKERIRRAVARLREAREGELGLPERDTPEDLGFRVYRLAESNLRPWAGAEGQGATLAASPGARDAQPVPGGFAVSGTPEAAPTPAPAIQPALFTDPLRDGWTPEAVITEIALREGYSLSFSATPVAGLPVGVTVTRVHDPARDQRFFICLDGRVVLATLDGLNLERTDLFVCRDSALDDDTAANLALQCRLKVI